MKRLALICAAAAAMFAVACKPEFKEVAVSSVKVTPDKLTLQVGTTGTLSAEVLPKDATKPAVKWASDNESVATVADDGTVTAVAEGTATVTAEADGVAGNAVITVTPLPVPYVGTLSCEAAENGVVSAFLTIGKDPVAVAWTYSLDRASEEARSFALTVDEALVATYNTTFGASAELLPVANYELSAEGFAIAAGAMSADISVSLKADDLDVTKTYVLPLSAPGAEEGDAALVGYIAVNVREEYIPLPSIGKMDLEDGSYCFIIANVDCSIMDPRITADYYYTKEHWYRASEEDTKFTSELVYHHSLINIVNLSAATVTIDPTVGNVQLDLGEDITYLLAHRSERILPVQDPGRKVCLTIKGGNTGIGFCNMTDEQIADFAAQVKSVIMKNGLDGVNLWDVNSGYDKEGAPAVNTTSYPKLIKALREALGQGKLVTVVDYETPTEKFYDVEACGGIEVGSLIDYAWSGYGGPEEGYVVVDPWNPDNEGVSTTNVRQPIAGLDKSRYGCLNYPLLTQSEQQALVMDPVIGEDAIWPWVESKNNHINNILVINPVPNIQGQYEFSHANWSNSVDYFNPEDYQELSFQYDYTNPRTGKVTTRTVKHKEYTNEIVVFYDSSIWDPELNNWKMTYNKWCKDWGTND